MHLATEHPSNKGVIQYLCREGKPKKPLIEPAAASKSTWDTGSHPEIVEYLWESVTERLPADCRAAVCGTPALVAPMCGVIFAVALGTEYVWHPPNSTLHARRVPRSCTTIAR